MWHMPLKSRTESDELKILRILHARMELLEKEKRYFFNKVKGFEGEVKFDLLTEKLPDERVILNDLLLEANNTKFQIDTTIFLQETLNLFEVKNYEGDYVYNAGTFYTISEKEIQNPLDQLKRSESLLRQLLQNLGYKIPIQGWLIFINPEFTLYTAPKNHQIILPTQLNRFMKKLSSNPSKLNGKHSELAEQLVSLHQIESPYSRVRHYEYEQQRKGITCPFCYTFMVMGEKKDLICKNCGAHDKVEAAVMRSVKELRLLFPDKKITTNGIYEWCVVIESKTTIWRILKKHMKSIGYGQWTYFE
jgi:hypothetical protein